MFMQLTSAGLIHLIFIIPSPRTIPITLQYLTTPT
jgi:hypothetical protein